MAEIPKNTRIAISVKCPLCEKPLAGWAEIIRVDDSDTSRLSGSVTLKISNVQIDEKPFHDHMMEHSWEFFDG